MPTPQALGRGKLDAIKRGHVLPRQDKRDRSIPSLNGDAPGYGRLVCIAWADDDQVRDRAQLGKLLDRLMCWTILSDSDAVVSETKITPCTISASPRK